jgi:hypothetical protein
VSSGGELDTVFSRLAGIFNLMSNELETTQMLRALRRIEVATEGLRDDLREVKIRLGLLEQQTATVSNRMDRLELRLERIIEDRVVHVEA